MRVREIETLMASRMTEITASSIVTQIKLIMTLMVKEMNATAMMIMMESLTMVMARV
jgi:hypothetical protein